MRSGNLPGWRLTLARSRTLLWVSSPNSAGLEETKMFGRCRAIRGHGPMGWERGGLVEGSTPRRWCADVVSRAHSPRRSHPSLPKDPGGGGGRNRVAPLGAARSHRERLGITDCDSASCRLLRSTSVRLLMKRPIRKPLSVCRRMRLRSTDAEYYPRRCYCIVNRRGRHGGAAQVPDCNV